MNPYTLKVLAKLKICLEILAVTGGGAQFCLLPMKRAALELDFDLMRARQKNASSRTTTTLHDIPLF